MIIALLSLALAMIVGGLLSAFLGWDIVLVERGWTMVIAGSISAASGALLLGVTAVISRLNRIHAQLVRLQQTTRTEPSLAVPVSTGLSAAALAGGLVAERAMAGSDEEPRVEERDEPALAAVSGPAIEQDEEPSDLFAEPQPPVSEPPHVVSVHESPRVDESEPSELKVPDFLLANRLRDGNREPAPEPVNDDLLDDEPLSRVHDAPDEQPAEPEAAEPVTAAAWPEPEPEAEAEPAPEPAAEDMSEEPEEAEARQATIIGTYNSGDNRYVMFSDGSIEAHTPSGVFRFNSLDELKEFIAAGGENPHASAST